MRRAAGSCTRFETGGQDTTTQTPAAWMDEPLDFGPDDAVAGHHCPAHSPRKDVFCLFFFLFLAHGSHSPLLSARLRFSPPHLPTWLLLLLLWMPSRIFWIPTYHHVCHGMAAFCVGIC